MEMDFSVARHNMVESQIRPNGVTSLPLISALGTVEREKFVDDAHDCVAYLGQTLPVGGDRFLLEPMVLARLLQLAEIKPTDLVLDIGPGTGYSSAVIARLAESVVGVEQNKDLCESSAARLIDMGITNAVIVCVNHADGMLSESPFDVIVVNGRIPEIPQKLIDQLSDGGRLVAVIGPERKARATVVLKKGGKLSVSEAFDAFAPVLSGFEAPATGFKF